MKPVPYHLLDHHHIIRTDSTICVDRIEIIPYPQDLLVSWHITSSTEELLYEILSEDIKDLLLRVILYRHNPNKEMVEFRLPSSSGTLQMSGLMKGSYYCELVATNSHNEHITIKTSSTYNHNQSNECRSKYHWEEVKEHENWVKKFSGYTAYE